jgi:phosphotransferase system enzyme I (PtsI)
MALAEAYPVAETLVEAAKEKTADPAGEWARFQAARERCADQITRLMENAEKNEDDDIRDILDFQYLILEDTEFLDKIEHMIFKDSWNCAYAVQTVLDIYQKKLQALTDNAYLRERAADVDDLGQRLLCELLGVENAISEPGGPYIAVAADLSPSRITEMDDKKLVGIVLEKGAMTAHTVIIARSRGIPCLIGAEGALERISAGTPALLDGFAGELYLDPDARQIEGYEAYAAERRAERALLLEYRHRETRTKDGFGMRVYANITSYKDVAGLLEQGAEGVGLFRTELLYMESKDAPPSEETQLTAYRKAAEALGGRPLVLRTLDVGGDKELPYLGIPKEDNPFLGYRAIRYCLDHRELFRTQLSAILRAGAYGNVQLMFPMIAKPEELALARAELALVMADLSARGVPYDRGIRIGMMVETPAAAMDAGRFADKVDFFSIGTNDLTQYLFAADRTNARISHLNSCFQPALLRAVNHLAECARAAGIEADICGQAGEVPELVPLWVCMGINNLSVSTPEITRVRRSICEADRGLCRRLLGRVLESDTEQAVRQALSQAQEQKS